MLKSMWTTSPCCMSSKMLSRCLHHAKRFDTLSSSCWLRCRCCNNCSSPLLAALLLALEASFSLGIVIVIAVIVSLPFSTWSEYSKHFSRYLLLVEYYYIGGVIYFVVISFDAQQLH